MSFAAIAAVGAGVGVIGEVGKIISRGQANKDMEKLIGQDPKYTANPIAAQRLGLAQTLLNARMPGAASAERNIYQNQANTVGQINRNATDSSQALALAAGTQGQSNQAFNQLGVEEAQDYQRRYGNLANAQEGQIQEQGKVFQDDVRRFGNLAQIRSQQAANRAANWGDVSSMGFGIANAGLSAGMGGFGGQGGSSGFGGMGTFGMQPMQGNMQGMAGFNFGGSGVGSSFSNMNGFSPYQQSGGYQSYSDYMRNQLGLH